MTGAAVQRGEKDDRGANERNDPEETGGLLRANGMTPAQLAAEIGETESSVYLYLAGRRMPKAPLIIRMARSLATTPDYILTGELRRPDGKKLYECDPAKHPMCKKTGCAWSAAHGVCYMTMEALARAE